MFESVERDHYVANIANAVAAWFELNPQHRKAIIGVQMAEIRKAAIEEYEYRTRPTSEKE